MCMPVPEHMKLLIKVERIAMDLNTLSICVSGSLLTINKLLGFSFLEIRNVRNRMLRQSLLEMCDRFQCRKMKKKVNFLA